MRLIINFKMSSNLFKLILKEELVENNNVTKLKRVECLCHKLLI